MNKIDKILSDTGLSPDSDWINNTKFLEEQELPKEVIYYCWDEHESGTVCPHCDYQNRQAGLLHPDNGQIFRCDYCNETYIFGVHYYK